MEEFLGNELYEPVGSHAVVLALFTTRITNFSSAMGDLPAPLPYAVNTHPFSGKVISVTGASRGLGLALSKYLLVRGASVSMCATSEENLSKAASEIDTEIPEAKNRYWTCVADISDLEVVRAWIEQTVARFGKLDGCANVAGRIFMHTSFLAMVLIIHSAVEQQEIYPIVDLDPDYFARIINVNVIGAFNCLREEMKVINEGGSIVNVGSIASHYASQGVSAYTTAKHALIGLTKVAAFEGAPRQVRVNALCPYVSRNVIVQG